MNGNETIVIAIKVFFSMLIFGMILMTGFNIANVVFGLFMVGLYLILSHGFAGTFEASRNHSDENTGITSWEPYENSRSYLSREEAVEMIITHPSGAVEERRGVRRYYSN